MTDRESNTLAKRGLEEPFFQLCCMLCQFLVLAGNKFWLYILLCTWSTIQLWCCVIFFRKKKIQSSIWRVRDHYYDRKKKSSSRLSGGCAIVITTGKKSSSRLSGGCAIIITTGKKKVLVVCLAGARLLLRPEKKKF